MRIQDIKTKSPFNDLFEIDENVLQAISENIRLKGFDVSQPIVIWEGKDIVIDGHTRLEAAKRAGVVNITTCQKQFADEQAALAYAIHNQRNRRNLTEAELLRCIEAVDKRRERGEGQERVEGKFQPKAPSGANGKSAEVTAKIVGTSPRTVERARNVLSDPEEKQAVMAGAKSINKASQDVKAKSYTVTIKPEKPKPFKLTLVFKPEPEGGYTVQGKDLKWLITDGDTVIECMENVLSIFQDIGEEEAIKELTPCR